MPKPNYAGNLLNVQRVQAEDQPGPAAPKKEEVYRFNLKLPGSMKQYLADEAWRRRISITDLLASIIEEYKAAHPHEEEL